MKVNDIKSFDTILETILEANNMILSKESYELKESLVNLFLNIKPKLQLNNYSYIYDMTRNINLLYNDKQKLLESINNYNIEYIGDKYYDIYASESLKLIKKCTSIDDIRYLSEAISDSVLKATNAIKSGFGAKHDKIVARDKKWLNSNKKKILALNFDEVELEVVSDYKTTFEGLINRHNIFDKNFNNSANMDDISSKLSRFEDKNGNLKNGLDNYFRTGTSRREVGLRKLNGDAAKEAVENMIAYCEAFMAGKSFLEEKLNNIILAINDDNNKPKEEPKKEVKESFDLLALLEANEEKPKEDAETEEEPVEEEKPKEEPKKEEPDTDEKPNSLKDRQVGIAVLLSVAEERYFDYIGILKGLVE